MSRPGLIGLALAALALGPAPARALQRLHGHVRPQWAAWPVVDALPATQVLHLGLGLPWRDPVGLAALRRDVQDPASPRYRQFLSQGQFAARFGPDPADYQALIAWARRQGLSITRTYRSRGLLDVSGSAAEVAQALHVGFQRRRRADGSLGFAVDREPSLDFDAPLAHISGLDDLSPPRSGALRRSLPGGPAGAPGPGGSGASGYFKAADLRAAYAPDISLRGAGQSVGLLEFDEYAPGDIVAYESACGLVGCLSPRNVYLDGLAATDTPGFGTDEVVLDIDMALAMAPAAQVVVYMGSQPDDVLAAMADDPALPRQFSSSWFWSDFSPNALNILAQFVVQGQSFFEASGDQGAYVNGQSIYPYDQGSTDFVPLAGSITDQPDVTVVGGTQLSMGGSGAAYASETTWFGDLMGGPADVGSGGGVAPDQALPLFQAGLPAGAASTAGRDLPDVSAVADNIQVTVTEPGSPQATFGLAGTSAAAPLWAGFTALVNQQAAIQGRGPLGPANAPLYAAAGSAAYAACFHDIADGSGNGAFKAAAGYDLCTGWGSPRGMALVNALLLPRPGDAVLAAAQAARGGRLLTYPNPYHPGRGRWMKLSFPRSAAPGTFSVYDSGERRVAEMDLSEGQVAMGGALYCGCDDYAQWLPPGTYYAVFQVGGAPLRCVFTVLP
jgi:subtilase family serine protease